MKTPRYEVRNGKIFDVLAKEYLGLRFDEPSVIAGAMSLAHDRSGAQELREAIDKALIQLSGGLTYFTPEAKHAQIRDAYETLAKAYPDHSAPRHERKALAATGGEGDE